MLYSKLGSIPKPETDGTEGWIEVEDPPVAGDGEEVVWWYPPGWVVRPVKPDGDWNWSQSEGKWIGTAINVDAPVDNGAISIINDNSGIDSVSASAMPSLEV